MSVGEPLLAMSNIDMSYGPHHVLRDVNLRIQRQEIVGLVGENGAGKSTLMNIMSGVTQGWRGSLRLRGEFFAPRTYAEAAAAGVTRVYQEQALVPTLSVYENMFLGNEARFRRMGLLLDHRRMRQMASAWLEEFGLSIDVRRPAASYSFATRQSIEIARACGLGQLLSSQFPLVLLDEPTSAIAFREIATMFERLREQKPRASFLFVSHRLTEVLEICDRLYVLKDGEIVAEKMPDNTGEHDLHELMVGRKRDADYYREDEQRAAVGPVMLEARGLGMKGAFRDVTLAVAAGEVLGIGGVLGSGKEMLGRVLAGIHAWSGGELLLDGESVTARWYQAHARDFCGYVPQERNEEGIIGGLPIGWNISLANLSCVQCKPLPWISYQKEAELTREYIEALRVRTPSIDARGEQLSGGNQQKIVLAKWMTRHPRVLVMDNPTRGMDAGAKEDIYRLIRRLSAKGMAIILISDELLELIGMSHRILIMKDMAVRKEYEAPPERKPEEHELVESMV